MNSITPTISNFFSLGKLLGPQKAQVVSEISCRGEEKLKYLPFYDQKLTFKKVTFFYAESDKLEAEPKSNDQVFCD